MVSYSVAIIISTLVITGIWSLLLRMTSADNRHSYWKSRLLSRKAMYVFLAVSVIFIIVLSNSYLARIALLPMVMVVPFLVYNSRYGSTKYAQIILFISLLIYLVPKVQLMFVMYPDMKFSGDDWRNLRNVLYMQQNGVIDSAPGGDESYRMFPIIYFAESALSQLTGLKAEAAGSLFFAIVGIIPLLLLYVISLSKSISIGPVNKQFLYLVMPVYAILQYPNMLIVKGYPEVVGLVSIILGIYFLTKILSKRSYQNFVIFPATIILALAHVIAPIIITAVFFIHKALASWAHHKSQITAIIVILPVISFVIFTGSLPSFSEKKGFAFEKKFGYFTDLLSSPDAGERLTSELKESFEGKYKGPTEKFLYSLNWAIPAAASISISVLLGLRFLRKKTEPIQDFVLPSITFVAVLALAFSFVFSHIEFAFARNFGGYGIIMVAFPVAYFLSLAARNRIGTIFVVAIMTMGTLASLTEPTMMPELTVPGLYNREVHTSSVTLPYPSEKQVLQEIRDSFPDTHVVVWTASERVALTYSVLKVQNNDAENITVVGFAKQFPAIKASSVALVQKYGDLTLDSRVNRVLDSSHTYIAVAPT